MNRRSPLLRYGVVPLAVTAAMLLRWPLWGVLGGELAFLFLWPVVMLCAWYGGLGPGLLATFLSATAAAFLLEPSSLLTVAKPADLVGLAVFVAVNVAVSLLCGKLHRSRREAERQAEEVARQREWLRVSLASIGDAVIATDPEGPVSFLNPAAQSLTGWTQAEARGQPLEEVFRIISEETRQPVEHPVAKVLREGVVLGLANHTVLVARDGTERPIEDSAAPIKDDGGNTIGVILVFHDVTERRRAERAVRESEEQFRTSFELAAVGKVQLDPATGRFLRVNRKFCEITGYGPDELLTLTTRDLTHPEDREADWRRLSRMLRGEEAVYSNDKRYVRKDGQPVWVNVTATLVRDGDGRPVRTIGVVQDLTARRAAEEALRESEERFRTLADSIPQLAWTARPDGHTVWYNRRWYEYTGTTPEQMEGWGWQSVHDPDELPKVLGRWKASLVTGEPFDMVFPLKGKDGVFRPFLTRVLPLRSGDGRTLQWFGTNTDISEIKEMEEKLREADRRKDQFLAMLAHELRNPLAPVRNALHILKSARADREGVEKARAMMERQVAHMARIVDDLLDVSRITRGKIDLRVERLDLARLVRITVEDHHAAFVNAGLTAEVDVPEVPVWVQGDPTRLTQVVGNLLQNAAKFTDRGGKVKVQVNADAGQQQAVLSVLDTGSGIEPEILPRLFDAFAQADRSLDRSKGGLGLGLALVKGLVELHGGQVHAASDGPGRGAEFVVRLPMQPEPAAITGMPQVPSHDGKKLRVLVVEDNRDAADSLKMLLEIYGYDVAVAYTGLAGVERAKEWRPDAILCDIGLPGLDGYGVVRELRRNPATAQARMIAVTGYGSDQDRERSQEAGFDAHLTKPADPAALQELLSGSGANT